MNNMKKNYKKTEDFTRANFVKELQMQINENKYLKEKLTEVTNMCSAEHKYGSICEDKVIKCECAFKEIKQIILSYGETFDSKIQQGMQNKILQIIDKVLGGSDEKK